MITKQFISNKCEEIENVRQALIREVEGKQNWAIRSCIKALEEIGYDLIAESERTPPPRPVSRKKKK